jgi:hypothetical protein
MPVHIVEYADYLVEGGRRLTGLVDLPTYRKAIEDA